MRPDETGHNSDNPLRHTPHRVLWIGAGTGQACHGCGKSISTTQVEVQHDDAKRERLRFHGHCYRPWVASCDAESPSEVIEPDRT